MPLPACAPGKNLLFGVLPSTLMLPGEVSIIPPVVIFFTSQRFFVEGAGLTGVKG